MARDWFLKLLALFCLASSVVGSCTVSQQSYVEEQVGDFSVEVLDDEIHVVRIDSTGLEIFRLVVLKNGGISEIIISFKVYATTAGWGASPYNQTWGSISTSEPIVRNMGDYVSLTCFSEFTGHPLSAITNMTICSNGLVLIHASLKAEEDAPTIQQVTWGLSGFPISLFQGYKAFAQVEERELQEINLPLEHVQGAQAWDLMRSEALPVYWIDFSHPLEGISFINLDTSLTLGGQISDGREWDTTWFNAFFTLTRWGQGSMNKNQVREVKIGLYIHGPGGHQSASDMINLLVELGKAAGSAREGFESYTDPGAKSLVSQALALTESAHNRIIEGDVSSAEDNLDQASNLLRQAEDAERMAAMMRDLTLALVPIIALIILVIVLRMRRRK